MSRDTIVNILELLGWSVLAVSLFIAIAYGTPDQLSAECEYQKAQTEAGND